MILNIVLGSMGSFKGGVGRTISLISFGSKDQFYILTNNYDPNKPPFELSKNTYVYSSLRGKSTLSFILLLPLNLIRGMSLVTERNISFLLAHKWLPFFYSTILRFFLGKRVKNYGIIYNKEDFIIEQGQFKLNFMKRFFIEFTKIASKMDLVDGVIVLNDEINNIAKEILEFKKVHTLRLGVSKELISLYKSTSRSNNIKIRNGFNLLFHGIIMPRRRLEDIIDAVKYLGKGFNIYISGNEEKSSSYSLMIRNKIKKAKLAKQVVFLGETSEKELATLFDSCDVFVFPSINQSWGLAPLEAMLFGMPVIVSKDCGVSEVLTEGDNCLFVKSKNPRDLADKILQLFRSKSQRKKIGRNARRFINNNMTYKHTYRQLEKILSE